MDFLITDIQEKEVAAPKAPSFPQVKSTTTGFPEHKKRTRISAFKQKRQNAKLDNENPKTPAANESIPNADQDAWRTIPSTADSRLDEKQRIDQENNERLASMSPEEIETARQELFSGLDSSLLERLLKRANLDDTMNNAIFDTPNSSSQDPAAPSSNIQPVQNTPEIRIEDTSASPLNNKPDVKPTEQKEANPTTNNSKRVRWASVADEDEEEATTIPKPKPSLPQPTTTTTTADNNTTSDIPPSKPHWPQPAQPADLDPHDPNFLENLHNKFFPHLPSDPSKLAWMAPIPTPNSPADYDSPYHPSQSYLAISSLRFDFRGMLLPPKISRAVPVTKGLHHHGEAPEAAGYTIKELARLCRSAVPGQRCMAYQTLGRVLYRLGIGEFGGPADDVAKGIWGDVEEGAVMRSLYEEAGTEEGTGHRSARALAMEAIWLLEKGGWKERVRRGK
ncbi:uncharacterized protein F4822DRAFT_350956 [Hypoxylon trugodes]|uniref:uncharacterized protein n=1 Tax=Hypoxylon trugodes TaxID=326681 RepID=UPI0021A21F95|nr:uncharacterized protein F4822DRAFT_350956 [Hypoxylon trugodes]KAI1385670.1 hypothetical protein F4822DRAFT_350956 [Hypoxylon trugodes]